MPKDRRITRANKKAFRGKQGCLIGLHNSQPKYSIPSPAANVENSSFNIESIWSSAIEKNSRKH